MDYSSILMIVVMIAIFYFLLIRPENKRKKQAEEMRNSIKKGERITTIGGMVGKVVQVNDSTIVFETSEDRVRIEIHRVDGGGAGVAAEERRPVRRQEGRGQGEQAGRAGERQEGRKGRLRP